MKKAIITGLVAGVLSLSSVNVLAAEKGTDENNNKPYNVINLSDSTLNQEGVVVSDVMTFDEVVRDLAEEHDISIQQASQQVISATESNPQTRSAVSPRAATYRSISQSVTVTSTYKPQIKYYCQTSEGGGSFRGIVKILDVSINRIYGNVSKKYSGKVYTNLENANQIFWRMDGDFYNNGTMSYNGGVEIKVGQSATVNFGLSGSTDHYKGVFKEGRTYW